MHKRQERLVKVKITHISQRFCEESCVQKVHASVLCAADILVNGEHLVNPLSVKGRVLVLCVGVSKEIPARTNERVKSVRVAFCRSAADGAYRVDKLFAFFERRFAVRGEVDAHRQTHGQVFFGDGHVTAVVTVDNRDRCAPIALTAHEPVTQAVVGFQTALAFAFEFFEYGFFAVFA